MQSNEVIRAKQKLHALVNNQEDLILTVGVTCEILHIVLALLTLSLTRSIFSLLFIVGAVVVFPGIEFNYIFRSHLYTFIYRKEVFRK